MGSRSISSFSRTTCSPTRVTTRAPPSPAEDNTLADGLFHLATWFLVVTAMLLIVRAWQDRELAMAWRVHFGMLLAGWGVFNVVEGLIDHWLLGIHHVRDDLGAPLGWDLAFLAFGRRRRSAGPNRETPRAEAALTPFEPQRAVSQAGGWVCGAAGACSRGVVGCASRVARISSSAGSTRRPPIPEPLARSRRS